MKFISAHNRGEIYANTLEEGDDGDILLIRNWDSTCSIFYTSDFENGTIQYLGTRNYPSTLKIVKENDMQNAIYKLDKLLDQERN